MPYKKKAGPPVPRDIIFVGVLMILSGIGDLSIIISYPQYSLPFFGTKLQAIAGVFIKAIHPFIHFSAGYGAIYAKKWAYPFFMAYSVYGIANAMANFIPLPPPGR
jgi:hypothetical protein